MLLGTRRKHTIDSTGSAQSLASSQGGGEVVGKLLGHCGIGIVYFCAKSQPISVGGGDVFIRQNRVAGLDDQDRH